MEIVSVSPRLSGKVLNLGTLAFLVLGRAYFIRLPHPSYTHRTNTVQVQDLAGRQSTHQGVAAKTRERSFSNSSMGWTWKA